MIILGYVVPAPRAKDGVLEHRDTESKATQEEIDVECWTGSDSSNIALCVGRVFSI